MGEGRRCPRIVASIGLPGADLHMTIETLKIRWGRQVKWQLSERSVLLLLV